MILCSLFFEFFKIGLFAIGGGLATIPFLMALAQKTKWFSIEQLTNMIALSESTPGPLGVNMATFTGIQVNGLSGGIIATLGLILPAVIITICISKIINKFQSNKYVQGIFYGLRPTISVMILFFAIQIIKLIYHTITEEKKLFLSGVLFSLFLFLTGRYKWHPICFILLAGILGIICDL